jgi:hypothetical protein
MDNSNGDVVYRLNWDNLSNFLRREPAQIGRDDCLWVISLTLATFRDKWGEDAGIGLMSARDDLFGAGFQVEVRDPGKLPASYPPMYALFDRQPDGASSDNALTEGSVT